MPHRIQKLREDAAGATTLLLVALLAGFSVNTLRARPLPLAHATRAERLDAAVARLQGPRLAPGTPAPAFVNVADVESALGDSGVLIIDVRPDLFFEDGHIPGAKNLMRDKFEETYPKMSEAMKKAVRVIVYCAGAHCETGEAVTEALRKLGHNNISLYRGGWDEWSAQNHEIEKGASR